MCDHWYVKVAVCYKAGPSGYSTCYWNWPTTTTNTVPWVGPLYSPGPNPAIIGRRPLEPGPGGLGRRHARLSVLRCCAHTERDRPGDGSGCRGRGQRAGGSPRPHLATRGGHAGTHAVP